MKSCGGKLACVVFVCAFAGIWQIGRADTYKVDPVHSFALFSVHHFNAGYVWGRFNEPAGQFTLDQSDPTRDSFQLELKVAKIDTGNARRDSDLKGPDWFNVRQYPGITFKSTGVKKGDGNNIEVTGDLTIHGVTKPVVVNLEITGIAKDPFGNTRAGIQGTTTVKRSDFGMKNMPGGVGDEVRLIAALEGTK